MRTFHSLLRSPAPRLNLEEMEPRVAPVNIVAINAELTGGDSSKGGGKK